MIKISATGFVNVGAEIQKVYGIFSSYILLDNVAETVGAPAVDKTRIEGLGAKDISATLDTLKALCNSVSLPVSQQLLASLGTNVPKTAREFQVYVQAVYAELNVKLFLYIPAYRGEFYEKSDILSDKAREAMPSCYEEIREAANCFATARYTSSVFHSMRAAEIGLRVLGKSLKISFPFPIELAEWNKESRGRNKEDISTTQKSSS